jgi:hypothetical protein
LKVASEVGVNTDDVALDGTTRDYRGHLLQGVPGNLGDVSIGQLGLQPGANRELILVVPPHGRCPCDDDGDDDYQAEWEGYPANCVAR